MKICKECGVDKPLSEFYWREDHQRYRGKCRACECKTNAAATRRRIVRASEEPREPICMTCFGLPHRIDGAACPACGLEAGPLFIPTIDHIMARENFGAGR